MTQTILFLRNAAAYESRELAIAALNGVQMKVGQPVIATYTESGSTKLVFAVGKAGGTGAANYEIIASEADLSDLTTLVSGFEEDLTNHEAVAAGSTLGHAKSGGDLTFANGVATVNENAITYAKLQNIVAENGAVLGASAAGAVTELNKTALLALLNVADGAEVNQNAFSTIQVGEESIVADQKQDVLSIAGDGNVNVTVEEDGLHIGLAGELSADKLKNPQTIELTGAVTGTVSTDFSEKATIATTLTDHEHDIEDVTGLQAALDLKAPLASPELTGTPLAPTAAVGTNTTQIATTAFVAAEINSKLAANNAMRFVGTYGTDGVVETLPTEGVNVGDTYVAIEGATAVNGTALEPGDLVICSANDPTITWVAVQTNIDGAVTGPASSVADNVATFNGATGKVIKDSGVAVSSLVQNTRTVTAGSGLTGGGALSADVTISHAAKPSSGTDAGGTGDYVSSVEIDQFGHVTSTQKATLPAESGKVKVEESGAADFLENKIVAGTANDDTNTYAVNVTKEGDSLKLTVDIDIIDGGVFD